MPSLSATERDAFHAQGFLGPLELMPRDEALALGQEIRERTAKPGVVEGASRLKFRHLDIPQVAACLTHSKVKGWLRDLASDEIRLWQSNLIDKSPGGSPGQNVWHTDRYYLDLIGGTNLSVWIALNDADVENGCLWFLPGSQRHEWPLRRRRSLTDRDGCIDLDEADLDRVVPAETPAGHCLLLHESIVHGSPANTSDRPRLALVGRYADSHARVLHEMPGYRTVAV